MTVQTEWVVTDPTQLNPAALQLELTQLKQEYDQGLAQLKRLEVPRATWQFALTTIRAHYDQALYLLWLHRHSEQGTLLDTTSDYCTREPISPTQVTLVWIDYGRYYADAGGKDYTETSEAHVTSTSWITAALDRINSRGDRLYQALPLRVENGTKLEYLDTDDQMWCSLNRPITLVTKPQHHVSQVRGNYPQPNSYVLAQQLGVPSMLQPL